MTAGPFHAAEPVRAGGRRFGRIGAAEVLEAALAHVVKNETEAACARTDYLEKRRASMQAREDYIGG